MVQEVRDDLILRPIAAILVKRIRCLWRRAVGKYVRVVFLITVVPRVLAMFLDYHWSAAWALTSVCPSSLRRWHRLVAGISQEKAAETLLTVPCACELALATPRCFLTRKLDAGLGCMVLAEKLACRPACVLESDPGCTRKSGRPVDGVLDLQSLWVEKVVVKVWVGAEVYVGGGFLLASRVYIGYITCPPALPPVGAIHFSTSARNTSPIMLSQQKLKLALSEDDYLALSSLRNVAAHAPFAGPWQVVPAIVNADGNFRGEVQLRHICGPFVLADADEQGQCAEGTPAVLPKETLKGDAHIVDVRVRPSGLPNEIGVSSPEIDGSIGDSGLGANGSSGVGGVVMLTAVLVTASRSASFRKCMGYPKQV
ncbi:hypothetical protein C8J57DRAFT_1243280 [Mycena rebaudengoi]|nr:hypothetical protein C8J57DRAFT_1243280 [Mycena rebaudengoi]